MKRILVVAQFTQLPGEHGNNRARFKCICERLAAQGYDVTEVTSLFRELDRTFRNEETVYEGCPYHIVLLKEKGYYKNISMQRLFSHYTFSKNLKKYLKQIPRFDAVYACVPALDSALIAAQYAKRHKIPLILDIQDLWPEAMKMAIDIPFISDLVLFPLKHQADKLYSLADGIVGVSETYVERALENNRKNAITAAVFIGTDLENFDQQSALNLEKVEKYEHEFWVTYIGSLGYSYDITTLIDAVCLLHEKGYTNIKPVILGSGPLEGQFKDYARQKNSNAVFTGWVGYGLMGAYLLKSDVAINAIREKSSSSIINKIGDYVSARLPIVNGSLNKELCSLINENNVGINYQPEDSQSMALAIEKIVQMDSDSRKQIGRNSRKLAEEKFNRKKTYSQIVELVKKVLNEQ